MLLLRAAWCDFCRIWMPRFLHTWRPRNLFPGYRAGNALRGLQDSTPCTGRQPGICEYLSWKATTGAGDFFAPCDALARTFWLFVHADCVSSDAEALWVQTQLAAGGAISYCSDRLVAACAAAFVVRSLLPDVDLGHDPAPWVSSILPARGWLGPCYRYFVLSRDIWLAIYLR